MFVCKLTFSVLSTLLIIINTQQCQGYRILGIFPLNGRSHYMMFETLMKGLAKRGHQVDVVNTFPQKTTFPNFTDIIIPAALPKLVNNMSYEFFQDVQKNNMVHFLAETAGNLICEKGLADPQLQKIIRNPPNDPPYDLVIAEVFSAHCFMAFGYHLKVPVIGASSSALYPWGNDLIGNPENLAFIPNTLLEFMENMSFSQRVYNVIHTVYYKLYFNYYTTRQDEIIKKNFGPHTPGVREHERNIALVLTNSHIALNGVKPTVPALIEVGGLHIQDDGPDIPAEHKKWLDKCTDGFVYFTFGSMITIETFPKPVLDILYKSLAKIAPIRVFMKIPQPELLPPGLPSNVRTFSWMPQLKVLKHKNIRAFITHGGLMGTQEAIYYGVPMIGMPLFADQFLNIDLYVKKKIAVRLDYMEMTEEKLDAALKEILYNPVYKETVKSVSKKFLDQPLTPLDTACFWIEYIVKYGSNSLRSPAMDLNWWQIALLDVYIFIIFAGLLTVFIAIIIVRLLIHMIFGDSRKVLRSKKIN